MPSDADYEVASIRTFAGKVFHYGPALIIPTMVVGSFAYSPWQHYGSWPVFVILLGFPFAALWHLAIIVSAEREKSKYGLYALLNLAFYVLVGIYCLIIMVTGDSL